MAKKKPIPKRLKALVRDALRRHAWNIGVSHYRVDILYMEEDVDARDRDGSIAGSMHVDRRYLTGVFKIFPTALRHWEEDGDAFIEHLVAHEVSHIATQHLWDVALATWRDEGEMKDAWESLTEVVARLSLSLSEQLKKK